jgi:cyclomaltodextrinase
MAGGHDPANRGAFPWHKPDAWDRDLLHEFQRLIALRRHRPALSRGSFHFLWANDGVVAVARQLHNDTIVAIFNTSRGTRRLDLPLASLVAHDTILAECWSHDGSRVEQGMLRGLELSARSFRVFATPPG